MPRLGYENALIHPHDAARLTKRDLYDAGVFVSAICEILGERRGRHVAQIDDLSFRFRDDFLGNDENIALFRSETHFPTRFENDGWEIVPLQDLRKGSKTTNLDEMRRHEGALSHSAAGRTKTLARAELRREQTCWVDRSLLTLNVIPEIH